MTDIILVRFLRLPISASAGTISACLRYYNPVTSLLEKDGKWEGMRNTAQLRRDLGEPVPVNKVEDERKTNRIDRQ